MSLRKMPEASSIMLPKSFSWDAPPELLARWADMPYAAEADDPNTIILMDVIGDDPFTGSGINANRIAAALRKIGKNDITVKINSPGGDMFVGMAIYNLLREHPAKVTVKVMGIAASAASLIAMAGDEIQMATGSLLMVHNAWGMVVGNRHDFAEAANMFEVFDKSMAAIYGSRTGISESEIIAMLDGPNRSSDGTFMTASEAVELGFADLVVDGEKVEQNQTPAFSTVPTHVRAKRRIEAALAAQGVPRRERASMLNEICGQRDAATNAKRDAGDPTAALSALLATLKNSI